MTSTARLERLQKDLIALSRQVVKNDDLVRRLRAFLATHKKHPQDNIGLDHYVFTTLDLVAAGFGDFVL